MANEIGKVAVRVYPDTTGFAQETKRKLERLKDQKYPVKVEVDENKLNRQIDLMVAKINATLAQDKNHIKFRAKLDLTNAEARSQVNDVRKKYQAMADASRAVDFDSKLKSQAEDATIKVTPEIDQEQFTRDLNRAVKQATRNSQGVSIWGDDDQIKSQAQSAADVFRDRLAEANRETPIWGKQSDIDAQAERSAKTIRERFNRMFRDFNIFGKPKNIEDDAVTAMDIFKRKWKAAQGELNIRADLEFDQAQFDKFREEHRLLQKRYDRDAEALSSQAREYQRIVGEAAKIRREMERMQKAADAVDKMKPGGLKQWQDITKELGKQRELHKNMIVWSREFGERNAALKKRLEVDSGSLVDSEAKIEEWRKRIEINAITLDVDLKTAATEAWLEFVTRPRVVQIRTVIKDAGLKDFSRNWGLIARNTKNAAANGTKWMAQLTGIRVLWHTFKDMVEWLPKLDMMVPQLAQQVALLGVGAAGAIGAFGTLVNLISDVAEVGKIALLAPAGLAGLALTAYSLNMAFANIADLAPAAAQAMEDFDLAIAEGIWNSPGGKRTATFIEDLFNGLTSMSPQIGAALGGALAALADGIASVGPKGGIRFIENYIKGFKNAEGGLKSFGGALATLGVVGSDVFGDLGTWFTDVMGDFDKWTKENAANGNLERWIRDAGTAMLELISIMDSTVRVFGNMSRAFKKAGFPGLTEMAAGMKSLAESTRELDENAEFMFTLDSVTGFFETMADKAGESFETALRNAWLMLGQSLNTLAGPIAGALDAIFDGFNSDKFQEGFENFIDGIGSFLEDISPGLEALTGDLGSLLGVVGTAAESWGPAFNDMLLMFSSAGDKLHPGLVEFIEKTGPDLQKLVQDITPHVEDFAEAISDLLGNENFQDLVGDLIGDLGLVLTAALRLGTAIVNLTEDFSDWYGSLDEGEQATVRWAGIMAAAFGGVTLAIAGLAFKIAPGATLRLLQKSVAGLIRGMGAILRTIPTALRMLVAGLRNELIGVGRGIAGVMRSAWSKVPSGIRIALTALARSIGTVFKGFGPMLARFIPKGFLGAALRGALRFAFGPVGLVVSIVGSLPMNLGHDINEAIFKRLGLEELSEIEGRASDAVKEATGGRSILGILWDSMKSLFSGDLGGFMENLNAAVDGLLTGMGSFWWELFDEIITDLGLDDLPGFTFWESYGFDGTFGGMMEALWTAIKTPLDENIDNLLEEVRNWSPEAFDVLDTIWQNVKNWLGIGGSTESDTGSGSSSTFFLSSGDLNAWAGSGWGARLWTDSIKPWLTEQLANLVTLITGWIPDPFDFFGWLYGALRNWLLGNAGTAPGGFALGNWAGKAWTHIQTWLAAGWKQLIAWITGWSPPSVFDILGWIGSKLGGWLGMGGETGILGGGAGTVGGGLLGDWGAKKWTDTVKPWLESGWSSLQGQITAWQPAGSSGLGSAIDRAIGTDDGSSARTSEKLVALGGKIGTFAGTAVAKFAEMGNGGRREITGLADDTDAEFGRMEQSGTTKSSSMSGAVIGNMLAMSLGSVAQATSMATGTGGQFTAMQTQSSSKVEAMKVAVATKMAAMQAQASAKAEGMKAAVTAKTEAMRASATAKAGAMQTSVTAKMAAMQTAASARAAAMQTSVISKMSAMQAQASAKASAMQAAVISRMTNMSARAGAQAAAMSAKVISRMSAMQSQASAKAASLSAAVISRMSSMASKAGAQASAMGAKVVAQMSSMSSRAVAQMVRFQGSAVRAISSASRAVVSQGRSMASGFASAMSSMASRAMGIVSSLRGRLSAGLRINASGAGSFTGGTFVSGLAGGLSRAVGVAYGMAGRIRGALSFSAYGSGSSVGGSFASGIRSRVGAVAAAASALAAAARRRMPNSPAKEGPFSGKGWGGWGESIGDELARGLKKAAPAVAKEADALMGGVTDALDSRAEIGVGASRNAAKAATAARIATAQAQGEESQGDTTAADLRDAVSQGLSDMLAPANDRDVVAIVRRANRNGVR